MSTYGFYLDLRFWHPSIDPQSITDALGRNPSNRAQAGDPKATPIGRPLKGVYQRSYWNQNIVRVEDSSELEAETAIDRELDALQPFADFLLALRDSGGTGMLEVNSWGDWSYALILSPETLQKASRIGLSIAHQVYATKQG